MYIPQSNENDNDIHDAAIKGMLKSSGKFYLDFLGLIQVGEVFWCKIMRYSRKFTMVFVSQVVSRIQPYHFVNLLHPKEMDVMTLVADALEVGVGVLF